MRDEALTGTLRRNCGDGLECFSVRERAVLAEMLANASQGTPYPQSGVDP